MDIEKYKDNLSKFVSDCLNAVDSKTSHSFSIDFSIKYKIINPGPDEVAVKILIYISKSKNTDGLLISTPEYNHIDKAYIDAKNRVLMELDIISKVQNFKEEIRKDKIGNILDDLSNEH